MYSCNCKKLFKMIHYRKENWKIMLAKFKRDSFAALCKTTEVTGSQTSGNPSV